MTKEETLSRIADRLTGIAKEDLTTAERQIVEILSDRLEYNEYDEVRRKK
jgi:hypothetical protein